HGRRAPAVTTNPVPLSKSGTAVDVTLLGRSYERFADHAVSVTRRMVYLVTGEHADTVAAPPATP
ncbi:hypothetical protein ABT075_46415, partial [Streptomyces sp. NPDC002677]